MPTSPDKAASRGPRHVEVLSSERVLDDVYKVDRAVVRYEQLDGTMTAPQTRLVFERGDSVAVLPYDKAARTVVLIRQFRYPVHVREPERAWLWETIAGSQEKDESAESVARRETLEEAGYTLGTLLHVGTVFTSPGGTSERVHLYVAPVTSARRTEAGGGVDAGEDIAVATWALDDALATLCSGQFRDAKTFLLLQYLALHWAELPAE